MQQPPPALYSPLSNHLMWLTTIFISVAQLLFVGIELYMLNKGFSIWDEGYYLLSYKMAQAGFYQHFTNTPFVVATLFEWFHPGIVAYRLIHLMANLFAAIFFTYVLILYLGALRISCNRKEQGLLYLLATYAALYSYQLAVPTLSYNHLNGFFILIAQAALMTAMLRQSLDKTTFVYLLLASCATAILVLIKPPSFVALAFLNIVLVILFFRSKLAAKYVFIYILGVFAALLVSLVLFLTPAQWLSYLSFMQERKTHTPYAVLKSFLTTGFEALSAGGG
ncbi:MAG: hypothetical protein ABL882_12465 [Sphingopyxis sp.]